MPRHGDALSPRQAAILGAVVEEFVETAEPVGSKVVRERYGVEASTATIRNEMCVLERRGLVRQPHHSAGRVPEDSGYRAYVDEIMPPRQPGVEQLSWVRSEFRRAGRDVENLYRTASRALAKLTSAPAMLMAAPQTPVTLTALRFTSVSAQVVLLTYETEPGASHSCLLTSDESLTAAQVQALARALAERYVGREIGAVSLCHAATLEDDLAPYSVPHGLLDAVKLALERDREQRVYVDGAAYALNYPEYQEVPKLRPVMEALDEETILRRLLRPAARLGQLTITIGQEQQVQDLRECSVVARHFAGAGDFVGALGVLGPTRLNYGAVVAAVNCVADCVSEAFRGGGSSEEGPEEPR